MDKRVEGLAGAMQEIAEQRDNQLRAGGAISADRSEQLQAFLAAELPVETALFAAARRRDESLSLPEPALPAVVCAALVGKVRTVPATTNPLEVLRQITAWLKAPSILNALRAAAVVATAVVITSAVLHFFRTSDSGPQISNASPARSIVQAGPAAFSNEAAHLTLRMNRLELAALDPSLLTINRVLPDFEQPDRVLPLDLPIRQIRLDVEAVRTP